MLLLLLLLLEVDLQHKQVRKGLIYPSLRKGEARPAVVLLNNGLFNL